MDGRYPHCRMDKPNAQHDRCLKGLPRLASDASTWRQPDHQVGQNVDRIRRYLFGPSVPGACAESMLLLYLADSTKFPKRAPWSLAKGRGAVPQTLAARRGDVCYVGSSMTADPRLLGSFYTTVADELSIPNSTARTIVWLIGEHDAASAASLAARFEAATADSDADVEVDLSGVTFLDASTRGVLLKSKDNLASSVRVLSVRNPSACALRLLRICGLACLIDSHRP